MLVQNIALLNTRKYEQLLVFASSNTWVKMQSSLLLSLSCIACTRCIDVAIVTDVCILDMTVSELCKNG